MLRPLHIYINLTFVSIAQLKYVQAGTDATSNGVTTYVYVQYIGLCYMCSDTDEWGPTCVKWTYMVIFNAICLHVEMCWVVVVGATGMLRGYFCLSSLARLSL